MRRRSCKLLSVLDPDGESVSYGYVAGRRATVTTRRGTTSYQYDAVGRVTSVTDGAAGTLQVSYDAAGQITSIQAPNQVASTFAHDAQGRPSSVVVTRGPTTLFSEQYSRDANGRVIQVVEASGRTRAYTYDLTGRLLTEAVTASGATKAVTYTYDALGNRLSRADDQGSAASTYDDDSRLVSDGARSYAYDAAGRLISSSGGGEALTYTYDGFGRLTRVARTGGTGPSLVTYEYDALGAVSRRVADGVAIRLLNDHGGGLPVALEEIDPTSSEATRNLFYAAGARPRIWGRVAAGQVQYPMFDATGSVRLVTDGVGASLGELSYDAFGQEAAPTLVTMPYRFAGERLDSAVGLYDLRARRYAPATGRFTSRDRVTLSVVDPRVYNPYVYSHDDPINFIDPSGDSAFMEFAVTLLFGDDLARALGVVMAGALTQTRPPPTARTGDYSSWIFGVGVGGSSLVGHRLTFDGDQFYAYYPGADATYFPPGGPAFLSITVGTSTGTAYNVLNEYFFDGVDLFAELSIGLNTTEGSVAATAGAVYQYRMMCFPGFAITPNGFGLNQPHRARSGGGGPIAVESIVTGVTVQVSQDGSSPMVTGRIGFGRHPFAGGGIGPETPLNWAPLFDNTLGLGG